MYGVEVEVLDELKAPDRDEFMVEAARAYRDRGRCLQALGKSALAKADQERADKLESEAKQLAGAASTDKIKSAAAETTRPSGAWDPSRQGRIMISNTWVKPVVVTINADRYRVERGEDRTVTRQAGPFTYEVDAVPGEKAKATLNPGETFNIKIRSQ